MMKALAATRPILSAEVLARLITEAGVPCVTLVPDDAAAAALPATPQDEGLRIVAGSMPVRLAYPIPPRDDDETRYWTALHRHDSHVLWLYDWVEQYRWSAHRAGPHAEPVDHHLAGPRARHLRGRPRPGMLPRDRPADG